MAPLASPWPQLCLRVLYLHASLVKRVRPGCVRAPSVWDWFSNLGKDGLCLAWSFPSPCFGRLCSHVAVALAWLLHWILCMLIFQMQTRCTISMDVRNSTEANLQNTCSNLQFRNRTESCKEILNKIIKSISG